MIISVDSESSQKQIVTYRDQFKGKQISYEPDADDYRFMITAPIYDSFPVNEYDIATRVVIIGDSV